MRLSEALNVAPREVGNMENETTQRMNTTAQSQLRGNEINGHPPGLRNLESNRLKGKGVSIGHPLKKERNYGNIIKE